jgi:hypothetical protein
MKSWIAVFALLFAGSICSQAQLPKGNIFFGYSYNRGDVGSGNSINLNGWEGSLEGKVFPFVGIVADFSGHYGSENLPVGGCSIVGSTCEISTSAHEYNFLFGPRVSFSVGPFRPFAHALFGASHVNSSGNGYSASDTSFGDALGGGLDYKVLHFFAVRLQADALQTRFYGNTQNDFRFSTGLVFNF